jgi:hypothetical protein
MLTIKVVVAAIAMALLCACSKPQDTPLPTDLAKWEAIKPQIEKLSPEDQETFKRYTIRQVMGRTVGAMGSALRGEKPKDLEMPEGMTIGKALSEQRAWEASQKQRELEREAEEARAKALRAKIEAERAAKRKELESAVRVTLVTFKILGPNYEAGRYGDSAYVELAFENLSGKKIEGVKGITVFSDIFDTVLQRVTVSYDKGISIAQTPTWKGSFKLNQFSDQDRKLKSADPSKLKFRFEPDVIIFADGTRLTVPE